MKNTIYKGAVLIVILAMVVATLGFTVGGSLKAAEMEEQTEVSAAAEQQDEQNNEQNNESQSCTEVVQVEISAEPEMSEDVTKEETDDQFQTAGIQDEKTEDEAEAEIEDETSTDTTKLKISASGTEADYDGTAHMGSVTVNKANGTEIFYSVDESDWSRQAPSVTDAKTVSVDVKAVNGDETAFASYVIRVNKRTLKVTTESATAAYSKLDGKALTAGGSYEGLAGDETIDFKVTGKCTEIGSVKNTYEIDWNSPATTALKSNYEISESLGTLSVTEEEGVITVSVEDYHGVYDGKYHEPKVTVLGIPEGYVLADTPKANAKVKDVTDGAVYAGCDNILIETDKGEPVEMSRFKIRYSEGELEVTPRNITLVSKSARREYNGKALTAEKIVKVGGGLGSGDWVVAKFGTGQKEVGSKENAFEARILREKEAAALSGIGIGDLEADATPNYEITYKFGTLTVTEAEETADNADNTNNTAAGNGNNNANGNNGTGIILTNGYEQVEVPENEVPLANRLLETERTCILHYILFVAGLLAMIICFVVFRKHRKKIRKLENRLAG